MKQTTSKHTVHGNKRHDFISLFSIILLLSGLLVLVYLLSFCHRMDKRQAPFFHAASAKGKAKGEEISEAVFLSPNTRHRVSLPPYSHKYFYIKYQRDYSVQILSGSSSVKMTFYTQSGSPLSIPRKNQSYHLGQISGNAISSGERIFLKLSSNTAKSSIVKVQYRKAPKRERMKKKQPTPRPEKKSSTKKAQAAPKKFPSKNTSPTTETPSPAAKKPSPTTSMTSPTAGKPSPVTKKPSSTAKKPTSTAKNPSPTAKKPTSATKRPSPTAENPSQNLHEMHLCAKPHFIRLSPGSRKELSLSQGNSSLTLADCTYFLTDSSIISVKNNTITGETPGATILYFRKKQSTACGSCLIRVIE